MTGRGPRGGLALGGVLGRGRAVKSILSPLAGLCLVASLAAALPARPPTLKVYAAASLAESLADIAKLYAAQGGAAVRLNLAASGTLVRQIQEGAPADLMVSADEAQMDRLDKAGDLAPGSRVDLVGNALVVVAAADSRLALTCAADLAAPALGRLAVGDPDTVPAGVYARRWLTAAGVWGKLAGRTVPCESVRAVLAAVESGEVDAGVVYRTDARVSRKVKVAFAAPAAQSPVVTYPAALLKDAPSGPEAARFLAFMQGPAAAALFRSRGFIPLEPAPGGR